MEVKILHNKGEIFEYLRHNPELQIYLIGDLDDFFWPKTIWYGLVEGNVIRSAALLYVAMETPTLLAFGEGDLGETALLLKSIRSYLPEKFNAHLSTGLVDVFGIENIIKMYGHNYKMALKKEPEKISDNNMRFLSQNNLDAINTLYSIAYPDNWFDRRMLETGKYLGYFSNGTLIGIAGIHVYSEEYKVAALGNITTHPDYRERGIAYKLTSALCNDLKKTVNSIGLNVKSDNIAAIKCYQKIGFEIIGAEDECFIKNDLNIIK
jgi:ribosomal protein S18 acetylase RimI-like enzyme